MNRESITRFIMTLVLVLIAMLAYRQFFDRPEEPKPPATQDGPPATEQQDNGPAAEKPPGETTAEPPATGTILRPKASDAAPEVATLGGDDYLGRYAMEVEVTTEGGGINSLTLSDYFLSVEDRELPPEQRQKLPLVHRLEGRPNVNPNASLALEAITLGVAGQTKPITIPNLGNAIWELIPSDDQQVVMKLTLVDAEGNKAITIRRTYSLPERGQVQDYEQRFAVPEAFGLSVRHDIEVHQGEYADISLRMRGPEGITREDARGDGRRAVAGWRSLERDIKTITGKESQVDKDRWLPESLDWAGTINKYFGVVLLRDENISTSRFSGWAYAVAEPGDPVPGVMVETEAMPLGRPVTFTLLAGPRDDDLMTQPVWSAWGMPALVEFAGTCCIPIPGVKELAKLMIWGINGIASVVQNYGLAIIILVLIIRLIMLPVSRFSQLAMLRMKEIQPEIAKLKERLKDDPQQLQLEQMKLMREKNANPMVGCLPMLLQIPIWIALYTGIEMAIGLRHAPFILWVQDLSQPDALLSFPATQLPLLSWIGNWANWNLNVLPVLMSFMMVLQMKMQPDAGAATPEMQTQQKIMKFMMPAMLLLFLYTAPAALNLYILTSSFIGFLEMRYFRWHFEQIKNRPQKIRKKGVIGSWLEKKIQETKRLQDQQGRLRSAPDQRRDRDRDQRREDGDKRRPGGDKRRNGGDRK